LRLSVVDIETDPIPATRIWCIVVREVGSNEHLVWDESNLEKFKEYAKDVDYWIAHNGIGFDIPTLNRLLGTELDLRKVIDTFVVSRTVNYPGFQTHSLDELGESVGVKKIKFNDFSKYTAEMLKYCKRDVDVTVKVYERYKKYIWDTKWEESLRVEHDMAIICNDMQNNGFSFDKKEAQRLLNHVTARMYDLEVKFQSQWPPELTEVNRLRYRVKLDGSLFETVSKAQTRYPKTKVEGSDLVCYDYKAFNPGSTKDRVEKLWEAGWKPTEKTKTHYKFFNQAGVGKPWGKSTLTTALYDAKKAEFDYYGWTVSEENLLTLPEDAPEAAKNLAEWLTLEGRRSSLVEWIGQCREDGRIHGKFWHIGAWTGRMAHSSPNSANISSAFHKEGGPTNAVEQVKSDFDARLRALWRADEKAYLVGTDAEGIQLRILAHYLKSDDYVHAIVEGSKEDETDIHNVNKRALGLNHLDRDDAKTFIYAHVLGAGLAKTARILRTTQSVAKGAVNRFKTELGLDVLRKGIIERDSRRGYFDGLDDRKVIQNNGHLMLAGYLQNGEAVVMKHANRLWRYWADEALINYKQVNFVHDEWQTECYDSLDAAEYLGQLQCSSLVEVGKRLGVYCPLAGSTDIGRNWYDTH